MRFHTFGEPSAPVFVLIHGMLTPYTVFEQAIAHFAKTYYVVVPVLDGHDGDATHDFIDAEQQAEAIRSYLLSHGHRTLFAVAGCSLGGVVAYRLWRSFEHPIAHLILDGAPLSGFSGLLSSTMTMNYLSIIKQSRARDSKTRANFERHFLPARFWEDYTVIADSVSDASIRNMVRAASRDRLSEPVPASDTVMHLFHGTALNEINTRKSIGRLCTLYPRVRVTCFEGDVHCYKAVYKPQEWIAAVEASINAAT